MEIKKKPTSEVSKQTNPPSKETKTRGNSNVKKTNNLQKNKEDINVGSKAHLNNKKTEIIESNKSINKK